MHLLSVACFPGSVMTIMLLMLLRSWVQRSGLEDLQVDTPLRKFLETSLENCLCCTFFEGDKRIPRRRPQIQTREYLPIPHFGLTNKNAFSLVGCKFKLGGYLGRKSLQEAVPH